MCYITFIGDVTGLFGRFKASFGLTIRSGKSRHLLALLYLVTSQGLFRAYYTSFSVGAVGCSTYLASFLSL